MRLYEKNAYLATRSDFDTNDDSAVILLNRRYHPVLKCISYLITVPKERELNNTPISVVEKL